MMHLVIVPTDLSKLSNVIKNDFVKNTAHDKLAEKVVTIDSNKILKKRLKMLIKRHQIPVNSL